MTDDLPASGDPGTQPPSSAALPRPAMWPQGGTGAPFDGAQEDTATPPGTTRKRVAWAAVAAMVVGVVLLGLAAVTRSWGLAASGAALGAVGAVVAMRARIMEDVSVSDSPHG